MSVACSPNGKDSRLEFEKGQIVLENSKTARIVGVLRVSTYIKRNRQA